MNFDKLLINENLGCKCYNPGFELFMGHLFLA